MKYSIYLAFLVLLMTSCSSGKSVTDKGVSLKMVTAKKMIKKHVAANFNENTVDAKLKVAFKNEKQNVALSVRMKIQKDEVIWLKGTKMITVFKAKITPEKVSFYSPYYKNYIEGDFQMLENILGVAVNFQQLQNMLLGQAMFATDQKHMIQGDVLSPKNQNPLFDVFYWVNQNHFKLDKQSMANTLKNKELHIGYPAYKETEGVLFPEKISINGKSGAKESTIDILVRSVLFNQELVMPFSIPKGYKEIKL